MALWWILIGVFVLFSFAPTVYELSQRDKLVGRTFELVHNYITDYHFYLSRIREGMEGKWTVTERYASEAHQGSFIQIFYLLLGKPVAFFSDKLLGATIAYHGARLLLSVLLLWLVSRVIRRIFSRPLWQILAFLVVVTASTVPILVSLPTGWRFGGYMSWWTVMDSLQRITFLPHLLFGQALIVYLLGEPIASKGRYAGWLLFFKFICAFILGMVFPPGFVFVAVSLGVLTGLEWVSQGRHFQFWEMISPRATVIFGGIPAVLYYGLMLTISPWKRLVEFDVLNPTWFPMLQYGLAVGPVLVFGILGALVSLVKREKQMFLFVAWVIAWMLLLFVFSFIPQQSALRYTEMVPHVPLGILSVYLFYQLWQFCSKKISYRSHIFPHPTSSSRSTSKSDRTSSDHITIFHRLYTCCLGTTRDCGGSMGVPLCVTCRFFSLFIPIIMIILGLSVMISSFFWQQDFINQKVSAGWPMISMNNVMVYPITGFTDALSFIEKNTPPDAVILTELTAGNYIPAFTGRTVFVGHDNTPSKEIKLADAKRFFKGLLTMEQAVEWLGSQYITYIFYGPEEKAELGDIGSLYPFIQEVYKNTDVTIYKVLIQYQ